MMTMKNDNSVNISLGMQHQAAGVELSDAEINLRYPSMDRDVANVVQFDIAFMTLLRVFRQAYSQCSQQSAENLPMYSSLIADLKKELDSIGS